MSGTRWPGWLGALVLMAIVSPAGAQPTIESSAVAMRALSLPVVDDDGKAIAEDLILATMRPAGARQVINPVVGALVGLIVFAIGTDPSHDCDEYDPCTPKERFYRDKGPGVGLVVGFLVGLSMQDGSIDRAAAVTVLRDERRAKKQSGLP